MLCDDGIAFDPQAPTILADFPRRNPNTGIPELLRVTTGEFQGRLLTQVRVYYKAVKGDGVDDGFRPTKTGITLREHELDRAIAALETARKLVQAEGRSTSDENGRAFEGERNPHHQVERPARRPAGSFAHRQAAPFDPPIEPVEPENRPLPRASDPDDDLREYRSRRP